MNSTVDEIERSIKSTIFHIISTQFEIILNAKKPSILNENK